MKLKKEVLFNLLRKYKLPSKNLNYNLFTSKDLDSLKMMNFIFDLEKLIKKKINLTKLSNIKNQTLKGLIKFLNLK